MSYTIKIFVPDIPESSDKNILDAREEPMLASNENLEPQNQQQQIPNTNLLYQLLRPEQHSNLFDARRISIARHKQHLNINGIDCVNNKLLAHSISLVTKTT